MKHAEHISEFLDGELDEAACEEIRAHLRDCPACRNCLESLKKTVEVLRRLPRETVPADIKQRLRASLRECMTQGGPTRA
ncbi:MAG: anti-sigma factor family protein [Thermodesulfobacteriota bacterium]